MWNLRKSADDSVTVTFCTILFYNHGTIHWLTTTRNVMANKVGFSSQWKCKHFAAITVRSPIRLWCHFTGSSYTYNVSAVRWPTTPNGCGHIYITHLTDFGAINISLEWVKLRTCCNGRPIGNRIWPIEWQQYQWPWVTLKVTSAVWNISNSHSSDK